MNAACTLTKIATDFEDPRQVVVIRLEPQNVTRSTKHKITGGRGGLTVKREFVLIGYKSAKSRELKRKRLEKSGRR